MRAWQTLLVLLATAGLCAAVPPSTSAPGGLTGAQVPQFVLLTHDDGVDAEARKAMYAVTKGREANGCPVTATMFTLMDTEGWTSCEEVKKMFNDGFEIAAHTISHEKLPGMERSKLEREIVGCREALEKCGIPQEDVVGLRTPYLDTDVAVREVLHEAGFLYESSLVEDYKYSVSKGWGQRLWPWDLGFGNPMNCSIADLIVDMVQGCRRDESFPGLWEVPVWRLSNETGVGNATYAMDVAWSYDCDMDGEDDEGCINDKSTVFDILKTNFDEAYAGNRAPMPIFIHVYWLKAADNIQQLQRFIDYAASKPDVYFVTMRQLLGWMQNPVPADELSPEQLGCGNKGGRPGGGEQERRRALRRALA